jgi:dihydroxy-acid dehydratase
VAGSFSGRQVAAGDVFEAIGGAGKVSDADLAELEAVFCPGPGACGGEYPANTMAIVMEAIGLSPVGPNSIPAVDPAKRRPHDRLMARYASQVTSASEGAVLKP